MASIYFGFRSLYFYVSTVRRVHIHRIVQIDQIYHAVLQIVREKYISDLIACVYRESSPTLDHDHHDHDHGVSLQEAPDHGSWRVSRTTGSLFARGR